MEQQRIKRKSKLAYFCYYLGAWIAIQPAWLAAESPTPVSHQILPYYLHPFATVLDQVAGNKKIQYIMERAKIFSPPKEIYTQLPDLPAYMQGFIILQYIFAKNAVTKRLEAGKRSGLSHSLIKPLALFAGPPGRPKASMINQLARPGASMLEKMMMAYTLLDMPLDIDEIKRRQAITQYLLANPPLAKSLTKVFDTLKKIEPNLYSLFVMSDPIWRKHCIPTLRSGKIVYVFVPSMNSSLFIVTVISFCILLFFTLTTAISSAVVLDLPAWSAAASLIHFLLAFAFGFFLRINQEIVDYEVRRLSDINHLYAIFETTLTAIAAHPELVALCKKDFTYTAQLLLEKNNNSDVNRLTALFKNHYLPELSYIKKMDKTWQGIQLLFRHIDVFYEPLFELARIGLYLSSIHLLQQVGAHGAKYALVETMDDATSPQLSIQLEGLWNPMLPIDAAFPNDFSLNSHQTKTVFITGANASGKTTFGLAVMRAALLSQVMGIAPCHSGRISHLDALYIYARKKGSVLRTPSYATELRSVKAQYLDLLHRLDRNAKTLAFFDAFLTSIDPKDAANLQAHLLEYVRKAYPNHGTILASHHAALDQKRYKSPHIAWFYAEAFSPTRDPGDIDASFNKIKPGKNRNHIGILLFQQYFPDLPIAYEADKLSKQYYGRKPAHSGSK